VRGVALIEMPAELAIGAMAVPISLGKPA